MACHLVTIVVDFLCKLFGFLVTCLALVFSVFFCIGRTSVASHTNEITIHASVAKGVLVDYVGTLDHLRPAH